MGRCGRRIDCYLDIASYYSYIGFADLLQNLAKLSAHGVQIDFHPVLIAGINNLSGNKPPWTVQAKRRYLALDSRRAAERLSMPDLAFPKDFLSMALTVSPLRALLYIKKNYPEATFVSAMHFLFHEFWTPPHVNLTVEENLRDALARATKKPDGRGEDGKKLFSADEIRAIMEGRAEMREVLTQETERAVEKGAFGLPWLWVRNGQGKEEPFFGSDRFHHVYKFLDVPYQDVDILPPAKL